jgi:predicted acyltransferase
MVINNTLTKLDVFNVRNSTLHSNERVVSVDALRGFDMFWIMGGDIGFQALDNVFHNRFSAFIKLQFDHAEWLGFHFEDIIMPLFLFLVGVSMAYSFRKRLRNSASDKPLWKHTIKRILILWILGMMVQGNLLSYDIDKIEIYSNTLQAIAAGYLISALLILYLPVSWQIFSTVALLTVYWLVAALIPVEGTTANAWSMQGNLSMYIDELVLGQFRGWWHYAWIVPSLNFGATTMLGVFAGYLLQSDSFQMKKLKILAVVGISLILSGLLLGIWQPVIKKIWTSSFVLFSGGICYMILALFYLLIDVWEFRRGFRWMVIIGSNAIFAYVVWHLFEKNLRGIAEVFLKGLNPYLGDWFEVLSIFGGTLVLYQILRFLYKNKVFIKI